MAKKINPPKMTTIPEKKVVKQEGKQEEIKEPVADLKSERTYDPRPSFELSADDFPEIKNWKTGEDYMLNVKVCQYGSEICDWGDRKGQLISRFKIVGIANDSEEEESEFPKGMQVNKKK